MYKSPIEIIYDDIKHKQEDEIYNAIVNYNIHVDKDELLRALSYDRRQYEVGYRDGIRDFAKEFIKHYFYDLERLGVFEEDISNFAKKMTDKIRF